MRLKISTSSNAFYPCVRDIRIPFSLPVFSRVQQYLGSIPKDSEAPIFGPFFANKEGDTNYLYRSDSLGYSYLRLYYPPGETKPDSMTWMSATGVFHAGLDLSTQKRKPIITLRTRCLNFPADVKASKRILGASDKSLPVGMPIGMEMTEFHILLLYSNTLTAMSNLDNDPVAVDLGNAEVRIFDRRFLESWMPSCSIKPQSFILSVVKIIFLKITYILFADI